MSFKEVSYKISSINRADIRKEVVKLFLDEEAGTGKGNNTSRYSYVVESYLKYKIIIKRPGQLNKGFDFGVDIDGIKFKNTHNKGFHLPSHKDIFDILKQTQSRYPKNYNSIKVALNKLYNLENIDDSKFKNIKFKDYLQNEHPLYIVLLAIKWLFIEQDITYWNWSGRGMLRNSLVEEGLM